MADLITKLDDERLNNPSPVDRIKLYRDSLRAALERQDATIRTALGVIGHACEKHTAAVLKMGFDEFFEKRPKGCEWCLEAALESAQTELRGANYLIASIEGLFPDWKSYRDLDDCIRCKLDELQRNPEVK